MMHPPRRPDLLGDQGVALWGTGGLRAEPPNKLFVDYSLNVGRRTAGGKARDYGAGLCLVLVGVRVEVDADGVVREEQCGHLVKESAVRSLDFYSILARRLDLLLHLGLCGAAGKGNWDEEQDRSHRL